MTKEKVGILKRLNAFFNPKLGKCMYCHVELRMNDNVYGNRLIEQLACKACYQRRIKPRVDRLQNTESEDGSS